MSEEGCNFIDILMNKKKVSEWGFIEIDPDSIRIYYNPYSDKEPQGFDFYVVEFVSVNVGGDYTKFDTHYGNPSLIVQCMFQGIVYWDGLRHLNMGDEQTDNDNYLYYANTMTISKIFKELRNLELKYCDVEQLESD